MFVTNFFNQNRVFLFICGIVIGIILTITTIFIINNINSDDNVIMLFETEGPCMNENSFRVFQVYESGDALALANGYRDFLNPMGVVALFLVEDGPYYDGQIIRAPSSDYCIKQIGIYRYTTKNGTNKTVPVAAICKKD